MRYLVLAALALPAAALAAPVLSISGDCPGAINIDVTGLTPGGNMTLLFSGGEGADALPAGACRGAVTGLSPVRWGMTAPDGDGDGTMSFSPTVPDSACGKHVQILDAASCELSSVETIGGGGGGGDGWYFGGYEGIPTIPDPSVYYGGASAFACADVCAYWGGAAVGARWVCNHYDGGESEGCGPLNHFEWTDIQCTEQVIDGVYVPGPSPACGGEGQLRGYIDGVGSEGYTWHAIECQCG
ncbi:MAG: hypothetical protein ACI8PZ_000380 [Myxococcota bacterium]|jgi:hypothetical protein